jgi:hypothetical protein
VSAFVVGLTCAHGLIVLSAEDVRGKEPPDNGPWVLFPLEPGDSIDIGDGMSCVVCFTPQQIVAIYNPEQIAFTPEGKLRLP